jgi:diguanylate cyclase (GGDEF)-like protein
MARGRRHKKIIDSVARPIAHRVETVSVGASIGIAMFPDHGDDHDALVHNADAAMYRAKGTGGGFIVFDESLSRAFSAPLQRAS